MLLFCSAVGPHIQPQSRVRRMVKKMLKSTEAWRHHNVLLKYAHKPDTACVCPSAGALGDSLGKAMGVSQEIGSAVQDAAVVRLWWCCLFRAGTRSA